MLLANRQAGRHLTLCSFATLVKCCLVKSLKALRRCSNNHMRWWCLNTRISEIMSCQKSAIFLANCMQFAKNGSYLTKSLKLIYTPTSRCRGYRFFWLFATHFFTNFSKYHWYLIVIQMWEFRNEVVHDFAINTWSI